MNSSDEVDRTILPEALHSHLQYHANVAATAAEHDKLRHSSSSGSLIVTDSSGNSTGTSEDSFVKAVKHPVPAGLKIIGLLSMVINSTKLNDIIRLLTRFL